MARRFLVVESDIDGRFLLSRALSGHFPQCIVQQCSDATAALTFVAAEPFDVVVIRKAIDRSPVELVRQVRAANLEVRILALGEDPAHSTELIRVGATSFLQPKHWDDVAAAVGQMLRVEDTGPVA